MANRGSSMRPPPEDVVGDVLVEQLRHPGDKLWTWARDAVHGYFHSGEYTGRFFERLGRDERWTANAFTPTDVVAVSMLGVNVPASAALELLTGERASRISGLLSQLDDVPLHEVQMDLLGEGQPATALWQELEEVPGLGRTKRSKLLARKRPALIPVFDRRIEHRLDIGEEIWAPFHGCLDEALVCSLTDMRASVGGIEDISLLRVLDVAVWRYDEALRPSIA